MALQDEVRIERLANIIKKFTDARFEELYREKLTRRPPITTSGLGSGRSGKQGPGSDIGMYAQEVPSAALEELKKELVSIL